MLNAVEDTGLVRSRLARAYLDDAMQRTGVDLMDPTQFNGLRFKSQIDRLGSTGKELFGDNWGGAKLAKAIAQSANKNKQRFCRSHCSFEYRSAVDQITAILLAAKTELDDALRLQVVRDFDAGTLSAEDAARYIVNPKRSVTEINRIKNFFKDSPEDCKKFVNMLRGYS